MLAGRPLNSPSARSIGSRQKPCRQRTFLSTIVPDVAAKKTPISICAGEATPSSLEIFAPRITAVNWTS